MIFFERRNDEFQINFMFIKGCFGLQLSLVSCSLSFGVRTFTDKVAQY